VAFFLIFHKNSYRVSCQVQAMTDESPAGDGDAVPGGTTDSADKPEEKMGLAFYATLALIGILVLMIVVVNYPAARADAGIELTQTNWTLQSYADSAGTHIPARNGTGVTALFDREGHLSGNAGCNWYGGTYQTRDYRITISSIFSTEMFCQEPGVMEQEAAFLASLSTVSSFRVSASSLNFYDAAGTIVLVFVPA
jgi:heat shock protein HslJ